MDLLIHIFALKFLCRNLGCLLNNPNLSPQFQYCVYLSVEFSTLQNTMYIKGMEIFLKSNQNSLVHCADVQSQSHHETDKITANLSCPSVATK